MESQYIKGLREFGFTSENEVSISVTVVQENEYLEIACFILYATLRPKATVLSYLHYSQLN